MTKSPKSLQDKAGQAGTGSGQPTRSQPPLAPLGAKGGTAPDSQTATSNRYDLTPEELLDACGPSWNTVAAHRRDFCPGYVGRHV